MLSACSWQSISRTAEVNRPAAATHVVCGSVLQKGKAARAHSLGPCMGREVAGVRAAGEQVSPGGREEALCQHTAKFCPVSSSSLVQLVKAE